MGNINQEGFILSNCIWVFPCSYRTVNIESRINSEYNLSHTSGLGLKQSYIVLHDKVTNKYDVVVGGYHFRFILTDEDKDYKWVGIKLISQEIDPDAGEFKDSIFLQNLKSSATTATVLDEENYFYGIKFYKEAPTDCSYRLNLAAEKNEKFSLDYNSIGSLNAGNSIVGDFYYDETDIANPVITQFETKDIKIAGNTTLTNKLNVNDLSTLDSLSVKNNSTLHNIEIKDTAEKTAVKITDTDTVINKKLTANENVELKKTLDVTGAVSLNDTLDVTGKTTFANNIEINGTDNKIVSHSKIILTTNENEEYAPIVGNNVSIIQPEKFSGHAVQIDQITIGNNEFNSSGQLYLDPVEVQDKITLGFKDSANKIIIDAIKVEIPKNLSVAEEISTDSIIVGQESGSQITNDEIITPALKLQQLSSDKFININRDDNNDYLVLTNYIDNANQYKTNIKLPTDNGTITLLNDPEKPGILYADKTDKKWLRGNGGSKQYLVAENNDIKFEELSAVGNNKQPVYIEDGEFKVANEIPSIKTEELKDLYICRETNKTDRAEDGFASYEDKKKITSFSLTKQTIGNLIYIFGVITTSITEDYWVKFNFGGQGKLLYASIKPDENSIPENTHVSYVNFTDTENNNAYYKVTENRDTSSFASCFFILKKDN